MWFCVWSARSILLYAQLVPYPAHRRIRACRTLRTCWTPPVSFHRAPRIAKMPRAPTCITSVTRLAGHLICYCPPNLLTAAAFAILQSQIFPETAFGPQTPAESLASADRIAMSRRLLVCLSLSLALSMGPPGVPPRTCPSCGLPRASPSRSTTASRVVLKGNVHPLAQARYDRGAVSPAMPINRMLLVLKRSAAQDKALAAAIKEMERPGSKTFHQWLTPEQIGAQYGAAPADIAKISSWLTGSGFNVTSVFKSAQRDRVLRYRPAGLVGISYRDPLLRVERRHLHGERERSGDPSRARARGCGLRLAEQFPDQGRTQGSEGSDARQEHQDLVSGCGQKRRVEALRELSPPGPLSPPPRLRTAALSMGSPLTISPQYITSSPFGTRVWTAPASRSPSSERATSIPPTSISSAAPSAFRPNS